MSTVWVNQHLRNTPQATSHSVLLQRFTVFFSCFAVHSDKPFTHGKKLFHLTLWMFCHLKSVALYIRLFSVVGMLMARHWFFTTFQPPCKVSLWVKSSGQLLCYRQRSSMWSVCLSSSIYAKTNIQTSPSFLCMLPIAMARSSTGSVATSYVLPVRSLMSHFPITGRMVQASWVPVWHKLKVTHQMAAPNWGRIWCVRLPCFICGQQQSPQHVIT